MKKRIFLTLLTVSMLVFIFAVSVSAAELIKSSSDEFGVVNVVDGLASTSSDKTARVVLKNADGTYSTFYTYYIYPTLNWRKDMTTVDFKQLNDALGTEYTYNSVIRLEALYDFEYHELKAEMYQSLRELHFPENSKITVIRRWYSNVGVLEKINIPASATSMSANVFEGCKGLTEVTFDRNCQVTKIPNSAFSGCSSLKEISLPDSVTTVDSYAFWGCTSLTTIRYGANLQTIASRATSESTTIFYMSGTTMKDFTGKMDNNYFGNTYKPTAATIFYTGTYDEAIAFKAKATHTASWNGQNGLAFANLVEWDKTKPDSYYISDTEWTIVYGYNKCEAFYDGVHETSQISPCVVECSNCKDKIVNHVSYHETLVVEYANGFMAKGQRAVVCTSEGCTRNEVEEMPALFTCLGYSAPENGAGGIAIGFTVNSAAIAEYKEITGKTVSYGIFAALKDRLNGSDIFVDGEANESAVVGDVTKYATAAFEIKIVGFETDAQKDAKIAMGAYVAVTDGETTEYSYMQGGEPEENEKYCFASFNDIVENFAQ